MTSYLISDTNPVPIYPGGRQGQVTVYNSGINTVWLSQTASNIDGIPILGGNSVLWDSQTPLYAYVQNTTLSTSVIIIDSGVTLPNGTVTVGGGTLAVSSIGAPVNVQGGGMLLTSGIANVPAFGFSTITIPLPANALTYYGLRITLSNGGPSAGSIVQWGTTLLPTGSLASPPVGATTATVGRSIQTTFFTPVIGAFPIGLILAEVAGVAAQVNYDIRGISTGPVVATTDLTPNLGTAFTLVPTGPVADVYLPSSYDSYAVYLRTAAASSFTDMNVQESLSGAWTTTIVSPVGGMTASGFASFVVGGSGLATRLDFNTVAGSVFVSIRKGIAHV